MHILISLLLTASLVYRALSHRSLTPLGTFFAALTAIIHAIHPWSTLTMTLLISFYLLGTTATKVKHDIKSKLTLSSTGNSSTTRSHIQVLANSIVASTLILLHLVLLRVVWVDAGGLGWEYSNWYTWKARIFNAQWKWQKAGENGNNGLYLFDMGTRWCDALMVGVMAQYAAVTADTLSSELGILSKSKPRLIMPPFGQVLPGTNGGVTLYGLASGTAGSVIIAIISVLLTPLSPHDNTFSFKIRLFSIITAGGVIGTILDSILGATLQASVIDVKQGKIIEGEGGTKVLVNPSSSLEKVTHHGLKARGNKKEEIRTKIVAGVDVNDAGMQEGTPSRKIATGRDLVDNNVVNLLMAGSVAVVGIVAVSLVHSG